VKGSFDTAYTLSNLNDVNNWLGRSQWSDDTANASYNEVRIWQGALSAFQLAQLHSPGPDAALDNFPALADVLPSGSGLALSAGATLDLAGASQTVASLAGGTGSTVSLGSGGTLVVGSGGNDAATFAGAITGSGTLRVTGTLRLIGDASLSAGVTLINEGVLDIITWNGTLPAGFVNNGVVLDRSSIQITQTTISGSDVQVTLTGYAGHSYQLQWRDDLVSGPWTNIGPATPGTGGPLTLVHPGGAAVQQRFYRVVVAP
jgi:hypothetical protein